jgi:Tol biopolymer transport system component
VPTLIPGTTAILRCLLLSSMSLAAVGGSGADRPARQGTGAYLGQTPPGETPVPFAPAILSAVSPWVEATEFSPDGTQFFLAVGDASYSSARLLYARRVNGAWTPFEEPPFVSGFAFAHEPVFSTDGTTLTFTGRKATGPQGLWTVRYADQGWGAPVALPLPVSGDFKEWRGSYQSDGTLYFGSTRSGMLQVYKAYVDAARGLAVDQVGPPISTRTYEGYPCIAPDGRFLVFYSARGGAATGADLFVSFADGRGGWGTPVNLGAGFNTAADEYGAHLSSDGRYLFFTRHSAQGNGIYWVATSAIDRLAPPSRSPSSPAAAPRPSP